METEPDLIVEKFFIKLFEKNIILSDLQKTKQLKF